MNKINIALIYRDARCSEPYGSDIAGVSLVGVTRQKLDQIHETFKYLVIHF
jgi:hypothetical protein